MADAENTAIEIVAQFERDLAKSADYSACLDGLRRRISGALGRCKAASMPAQTPMPIMMPQVPSDPEEKAAWLARVSKRHCPFCLGQDGHASECVLAGNAGGRETP